MTSSSVAIPPFRLLLLATAALSGGELLAATESSLAHSLSDFHLLRPLWLLALLPSVLVLSWLRRIQLRRNNWRQAIDSELLAALTDVSQEPQQRRQPLLLLALAWLLAVIALAGPTWQRLPQPVYQQQEALVLALDLSPSMYATDVSPSRLVQARREIRDLLRLRAHQGGSTALIAYAGDAHVVTPLTEDTRTIELLLPSLSPGIMPLPGNNPLLALEQAEQLIRTAQVKNARILLITDGIPASDFKGLTQASRSKHHELSILGIGDEAGAPIPLPGGGFLKNEGGDVIIAKFNQRALERWADKTGVRYRHSHFSDADLEWLLAPSAVARALDQEAIEYAQTFDSWRDLGPWLVLALLPLALVAFRRGWLLGLALALTLQPSQPVHALSWQELWLNDDQRGQRALQEDEPEQAAKLFNDEQWRGVARYQAGDYAGAAEAFAREDSSSSNYNRGNALAMAGDLDAAIEAYDRALELDPENRDAAQNKRQVEALREQQRQQPQQQRGDASEDQRQGEGEGEGEDRAQGEQSPQPGQQSPQPGQQNPQPGQQNPQQGGQEPQPGEQNPQPGEQRPHPGEQRPESEEVPGTQAADANDSPPEDAQHAQQADGDETDSTEQQGEIARAEEDDAADRALQQWLRQIPDEPGKLLQRKFDYQYRQQKIRQQNRRPSQQPGAADQEERY